MPFADGAVREERPSGGRRIGFPERTIGRTDHSVAPVEYLTYGIRTMFVLLRVVGDDAHIVPAEYVVLRKSSANS